MMPGGKKPLNTTDFQMNYDPAHGTVPQLAKVTKSGHGKTQPAPSAPGQKPSSSSGQFQQSTIIIPSRNKLIECLEKSKLFESLESKGVEITVQGDNIIITSDDRKKLKTCKDKIDKNIEQVCCKGKDITNIEADVFTKEDVVLFIDKKLGIQDGDVSWEVVLVHDQARLNVYAMDKKNVTEMIKQIFACIVQEKILLKESKSQWFQDLLKDNSSKLATTHTDKYFVIYTTLDVHHEYFVVRREKCNNFQGQTNQKGPQTNQHSTKGDKKAMTANRPALTGNQQMTTTKRSVIPADDSVVTADHSDKQVLENSTYNDYNKNDQGHIDEKKVGKEPDTVTLGLNLRQYQYLDKFLSDKVDDIFS